MRTEVQTSALISLWSCLSACAGSPSRDKGELAPIAGLSAAAVSAAAAPRRVALLFGVNHFVDPFWPDLRWAAKDARDFGAILGDEHLGRFDQVTVLTEEGETTKGRVMAQIQELVNRAPRPEDAVVLYFSAHGTLVLDPFGVPERVLVLSDTQKDDLRETGLLVEDLLRAFSALPSKKKLLVLATCHSGSGKSLYVPAVAEKLRGLKGPAIALSEASRASMVFSAADFGQPAREDDRLENDVYTHFFMDALVRGADANQDGGVSATEAHDYARVRTYEFTEGLQIPTVESMIVGTDPVVLAGNIDRPGLPVLFGYSPALAGLEVRVFGQLKGVLPGNIVLEPGPAVVSLVRKNGESIAEESLDLAAGDRVAAEVLLDRTQPHFELVVSGGVMGVLDSGISSKTWAPTGAVSLGFRLRDLPWQGVDPSVDLTFGYSAQTVTPGEISVEQQVTAVQVGAGVAFALQLGPTRIFGGPHLAFLFLNRALKAPGFSEDQSLGVLLPGLSLGTSFEFGRLVFDLEGRFHYLPLVLDGRTVSLLAASALGGAGVRF